MEVLAGSTAANEADARVFLLNFNTLQLTAEVAEQAVAIRKARRIKLPAAVIQATAELSGRMLSTRNSRDFPSGTPGVRIPYTI
jgi:predicted nucleic acid-binding protein